MLVGMGIRKALEFLMKDYLSAQNPEEAEAIQKKRLGQVISDHVDDQRIKDCAKMAAWLGNDETHYVRKWVDKDLRDLKLLMELTAHWISMDLLTQQYKSDMM